ncbi:LuxR C-terminal-related transcriptional regulator [Microcoleus sp. FACHB-SPT15]
MLTRREQEILAIIAAGRSNQEIADLLYITPDTVRVH